MVFWFVPFAVIALFLSLGVYLAVIGPIRRGFKTLPILRHGVATQGVPIDVKETGLRMNQTPEMRVTYRFQAADGNEHEAFVKSFHVEKLTDEPTKVLLYDPGNPDHLFVFDALPKGIKLLPGGYFDANPARLILPIFFVAILITEIVVAGAFMFRFDRATFSPANSAPVQASANAEPSNAD